MRNCKNKKYIFIIILLFCSFVFGDKKPLLTEYQICELGTKYNRWFYSSELDSLILKFSDKNYNISDLKNFRHRVDSQLGKQLEILNIQFGIEPNQNYYIQYSNFQKSKQPVRIIFAFDNNGIISQYSVVTLPDEAKSKYLDYKCKTKLSLPFKDKWFVAWGGRNINENQHAVALNQRFAYDFLIRKHSKTFIKNGKTNSNYFAYKKEVISPGKGKVIKIISNINDNDIGHMPKIHGNHIIIDHENGEYSVLSHFKKKSITVKEGDQVGKGQYLGLCGNSGHSSEPHIHYHLQNSPDIDKGEGLPIKFVSYNSNGKYFKMGEPKIGEYVENK